MKHEPVFHTHSEIMSGAPVFVGTRVLVRTLLDYVEAGNTVDDFLEDFPGVRCEQALQFMEESADERLNFIARASRGLQQIDEGRVLSHEEAKRRLGR